LLGTCDKVRLSAWGARGDTRTEAADTASVREACYELPELLPSRV
jgi:hypothetical protein